MRVAAPLFRLAAMMTLMAGGPVQAQTVTGARFVDPTDRYDHAVLGDAIEYGGLEIVVDPGAISSSVASHAIQRRTTLVIRLPLTRVFEDIAPRLWDVDGDGQPEVIVVETDVAVGAQLAIYDATGRKRAATPPIGQRHRWLAPVGAADLDGDGHVEIAYVDRPHLAKTLRIWRFETGQLVHVADQPGLTNHRIGWNFIAGGLRHCPGSPPELITATADWTRIAASRLVEGNIRVDDIGDYDGPESLTRALSCT